MASDCEVTEADFKVKAIKKILHNSKQFKKFFCEVNQTRKDFKFYRIGLVHQHGRRFMVLEHQYVRGDVMWNAL